MSDPGEHLVRIRINGNEHEVAIEPRTTLADYIRDRGLTGTHVGCEHGVCGSCTVVVDGEAIRSCLMLAVQADGGTVDTVEGLAGSEQLDALQEAFATHHGLQCGFCTPGILMALAAARDHGDPFDVVEREVLSGHLCRCTGYAGIRAAIRHVWDEASP